MSIEAPRGEVRLSPAERAIAAKNLLGEMRQKLANNQAFQKAAAEKFLGVHDDSDTTEENQLNFIHNGQKYQVEVEQADPECDPTQDRIGLIKASPKGATTFYVSHTFSMGLDNYGRYDVLQESGEIWFVGAINTSNTQTAIDQGRNLLAEL